MVTNFGEFGGSAKNNFLCEPPISIPTKFNIILETPKSILASSDKGLFYISKLTLASSDKDFEWEDSAENVERNALDLIIDDELE